MATVQLALRGTPFVYEGQELGFANVAWPSIDYYNDPSSHNQYNAAIAKGHTEEEALACVHRFSRDNARTPMQWNDGDNAGFSTATPWLPVHDDYATCNVAAQEADTESPLCWYRRLADLRMSRPELVAGDWRELLADDNNIMAFERTLDGARTVTLANFSDEAVTYAASLVAGLSPLAGSKGVASPSTLRPLEAVIFG
jgi:alpha-glucosidase